MTTVYTIGHSNLPVEKLLDALLTAGVQMLVDIRRYPASRRNPQFNRERLAASLRDAGIDYRHLEALGGRREPAADSRNLALSNDGFRGYADYTVANEFEEALRELIDRAERQRTAVMCAEALPSGCHRSILADLLVGRGQQVIHLYGGGEHRHELTPTARLLDGRVTYPALL